MKGDFSSEENQILNAARVLAITSSKGGVGKTNSVLNLGVILSAQGKKVCIVDADIGQTNVTVIVGLESEYSLEDVISGKKNIDEVLVEGPKGIKILPTASSLKTITASGSKEAEQFASIAEKLERDFDYILIDTSSNSAELMFPLIMSSQETILIVSPEPASQSGANSLLEILQDEGYTGDLYCLTNLVMGYDDSIDIFNGFNESVKEKLHIEVKYLGYVPMDHSLISSAICREPVVLLKPDSPPSRCLASVIKKLQTSFDVQGNGGFSSFWKEYAAGVKAYRVKREPEQVFALAEASIQKESVDVSGMAIAVLTDKLRTLFTREDLSEDEASALCHEVESAFVKRFDRQSYDVREVLDATLEQSGYGKEEVKDVCRLLQEEYEKRHNEPLNDLKEVFFKLLDNSEDVSGESLQSLHRDIVDNYQEKFGRPVISLEEAISNELLGDDFPEQGFSELIDTIKQIYAERFEGEYLAPDSVEEEKFEGPVISLEEAISNELLGDDFPEQGFTDLIDTIKQIYAARFGGEYLAPDSVEEEKFRREMAKVMVKLDKFDRVRTAISQVIVESYEAQDELEEAIRKFSEQGD